MDKVVVLDNKSYLYLGDYNIIINSELEDRFEKYSKCFPKVTIKNILVSDNTIRREIKHNLRQITFEMTQDCNLRCKYCIFDKSYIYHRNRSDWHLSYVTAKASLDYLFSFFKDRYEKKIAVSFYGGEPLLNFSTIKKIVEYSLSKFKEWDIHFSMTTNGILLNDDIADYLIGKNFGLLVSLDGPKEIHDAKRVFSNGKGSYRVIMDNLNKLQKKDTHYYHNNVSFSAVWSPGFPIKRVRDFYSNNKIVKDNRVDLNRAANSKPCNDKLVQREKDKEREHEKDNLQTLRKITEKVKQHRKLTCIEYNLFINGVEESLKYRSSNSLYGSCFFSSRLYIDAKGDFHICHMINNRFPIGNAYTGFNFKRMEDICKKYSMLNEKYCKNCEVNFLCMRCFVTFTKTGTFQFDPDYCRIKKNQIIASLERYIKDKKEGISYS